MSKIALSGNASGTGTFTLASPNSSTDRTLDLPDAAGTIQVSGNPISGTTGTFTGLVDISAAGAGQIAFPATQNASANANTLDDYEEGTWTPTDSSGAGLTFTVDHATYTKVGRAVSIQANITYPSTASAATAQFAGFPFAAANSIQMSVIYSDAFIANFTYLSGNTSTVFPLTPGVNVTNATLSGKLIAFAGTYFV
jgi:hypothetical protein